MAKEGTSRNRTVWYWRATLPLPVLHGDPAGTAQGDIGQSWASTRAKSSSFTPWPFQVGVSPDYSYATPQETMFVLDGRRWTACFMPPGGWLEQGLCHAV
nr:hypothetical protein GCM10010200_100120 [Actinomadura rugatobispora]